MAAGLALACAKAGGGWDWRAFADEHSELVGVDGERLRDAHPYPLPLLDAEPPALELVLCRWPGGRPLSVSLPPDADPDERALIGRALRAWQDAGLGIVFAPGAPPADVEIRFVAEGGGSAWPRTALTAADCRIREPAEIVRARIWLDRANLDLLGRPQRLSEAEIAGTALHEIGHALGFQGHAAAGSSVMVRETDRVRGAGLRLLSQGRFGDSTLRALYSVPTGARVGRIALSAEAARMLRRLGAHAERVGYVGPFSRVGDRAARIFWLGPDGDEVGVVLRPWPPTGSLPDGVPLRPDRRARGWLSGG